MVMSVVKCNCVVKYLILVPDLKNILFASVLVSETSPGRRTKKF